MSEDEGLVPTSKGGQIPLTVSGFEACPGRPPPKDICTPTLPMGKPEDSSFIFEGLSTS